MVELKVSLEKKHVWLLALLIVAVGFVIAAGGEVSHTTEQITGLDAKIKAVEDKVAAVKLDCTIAYGSSRPPKQGGSAVKCPDGYVLTGGGGSVKWPENSRSIANLLHGIESCVPKVLYCNDYAGLGCWDLTAVCCRISV